MASLLGSLTKVGGNTLISRILGFVRDLVLARAFGAGAEMDAFLVAFKIPNFLRRLFAEGAFAAAFVPVLSEYRERRSFDELKSFVDRIAGTLGGVLLAITLVGVLFAPVVVFVFAPGFMDEPDKSALATDMLRLTFPYLFFISLTAFAGGILNAHHRFGIPAFTPVLLNVTLISAALGLAPFMERPIEALAWGVFAAGLLQLAFQIPFLRQIHLLPRPLFAPRDPGVVQVVRLMIPAMFGVSVNQINLLIDTLIASFLQTGSISWLYYSDRLMEFPLGILGVALGTVILPNLSQKHAAASPEGFSHTLDWGLRLTLLLGLPAAAGLFMLAGPMMAALFQSSSFTSHDVEMARQSLMAFAVGVVPLMLIKILAPGFYARQNTRTPVRIGIIAMIANMLFMALLALPFAHVGLAMATTISAFINAGLLYRGLRREGVYTPPPGWWALLAKMGVAAGLMAAVLGWGAGDLDRWLAMGGWGRILHLVGWIGAGAAVYGLALLAMGLRVRHLRTSC